MGNELATIIESWAQEAADEVTAEEQALMALKLQENVRDLIRSEVQSALQDYDFLSRLMTANLFSTLMARHQNDSTFRIAVRDAVKMMLDRTMI
jgi:hypothetical protein